MTGDEAAELLSVALSTADPATPPGALADVRRVFAGALAGDLDLPTSWYDVWDRVSNLEAWVRADSEVGDYNFGLAYRLLNVAVNTRSVPFPRDVG
jgi:hypothetical protein